MNYTSNSLNGYLAHSNYTTKIKNKISLDNSLKTKNGINCQKRANSTLEENNKYYIKSNKENNVYVKYIPSSSNKQYSNIKNNFNSIISKKINSKVIIPNHMKNSSLFSSTLSALYKPNNNNDKLYFDNKVISKTSLPSGENSRKNSNDKRSCDINNNNNLNNTLNEKNKQIKVNSNNYYHNNLLIKNDKKKKENTNQDIKKIEQDTERDYFMSADEALKYGLIDKIL